MYVVFTHTLIENIQKSQHHTCTRTFLVKSSDVCISPMRHPISPYSQSPIFSHEIAVNKLCTNAELCFFCLIEFYPVCGPDICSNCFKVYKVNSSRYLKSFSLTFSNYLSNEGSTDLLTDKGFQRECGFLESDICTSICKMLM